MSLRIEFVKLASSEGANIQRLCERFGISRPTGYKWLARHKAEGIAGLEDRSRRPLCSPARTSEEMERAVLAVRDAHPAWGGRKVRKVLTDRSVDLSLGEALPSASTITQVLRRNGRLDPQECSKHQPFRRFEQPHPNAMWQMDFKGHFGLSGGQRCHPLTVIDDFSRFCLLLSACPDERTTTVREQLTACFQAHGLPEAILCDNGPPWGGAGARNSHTALSVWLIRLGVRVYHGRPWHPQTQGKDERFHRTLLDELVRPVMGLSVRWNAGASAANKAGAATSQSGKAVQAEDRQACQAHFDPWRTLYNQVRPHEAIGMQTPASRYQPSQRPFPDKLAPIEYAGEPGQLIRQVHPSGEISFQSRRYYVGSAFAGQPVAVRPTDRDGFLNVFYCQQKVAFIDLKATKEA